MRGKLDRLLDTWDDLGLWNQYGLATVGSTLVLLGLLEVAPFLA